MPYPDLVIHAYYPLLPFVYPLPPFDCPLPPFDYPLTALWSHFDRSLTTLYHLLSTFLRPLPCPITTVFTALCHPFLLNHAALSSNGSLIITGSRPFLDDDEEEDVPPPPPPVHAPKSASAGPASGLKNVPVPVPAKKASAGLPVDLSFEALSQVC